MSDMLCHLSYVGMNANPPAGTGPAGFSHPHKKSGSAQPSFDWQAGEHDAIGTNPESWLPLFNDGAWPL